MEDFEQLFGIVERVLFQNDENGYAVIRLKDWNGENCTVTGCLPDISCGEQLEATGSWTEHPSYGKQFSINSSSRYLPDSSEGIFAYLSSGVIKGIGPAIASKIVSEFGSDSLNVLACNPEKLSKISGISPDKAKIWSAVLKEKTGLRTMMEFVCPFGVKPIAAARLHRQYGNDAIEVVRNDPYVICQNSIGGSFSEADCIAAEMGITGNDRNRVRAAVIYVLQYHMGKGHCFIPRDSLVKSTSDMIGVEPHFIEELIDELAEMNLLVLDAPKDMTACYLPDLYEAEEYSAKWFSLNRDNVFVITGGPGTGKTTLIKQYIETLDERESKYYLIAPTGRAAKRMTEVTGKEATTIHRLLEAKFSRVDDRVVFDKNENDKLDCDAVIVDECSMIDVPLLTALLKALPENTKLVLVGDADQLPPVGPGIPFRAIIDSGVFQTKKLEKIYRQSADSRIIMNAHMINRGEHPDFSSNSGDFFRLKRLEAGSSVDTICELFATRLPAKMGFSINDIQVLSPTRRGELGTVNLNSRLQEVLNPAQTGKNEYRFGERVFREGDRIMQVRNNYDLMWQSEDLSSVGIGIFNGDIGTILSIDPETQLMTVDFDSRIVSYPFSCLNEMEHAWAITVHKSQGCEFKAVILALSPSSKMLLTRDVLYTGVTRARDILILVGDDYVADSMIDNYKKTKRFSYFRLRIMKYVGDSDGSS